ncbi:CHAP domain-containing protein [Parasphingopyxis algicola]|uniref:CHAP domain-containing protein n=1 Tax=Parasphingopyxis algicola TaxID=2026624 RepID=UPI0015A24576|nr:CHAP domain-containing protein [Parasphingopyxis algicola]QLC26629.1 CHAP domain-containing protein [Parasphingopyxis algicola]
MFPGRLRAFPSLLAVALLVFTIAAPADARDPRWQCVTYARSVSDIEIRGNAHTWWASAEGRYERGSMPEAGSVMVLQPHGRMRLGHVAMVREIVNDRQIRLNHANWSRRGMVESDVLAEDVSPNNDWSVVKVWHTPTGQLGITNYPVYGFIYPEAAEPAEPEVQIAATETDANRALLASYEPGAGDRIGQLIEDLD